MAIARQACLLGALLLLVTLHGPIARAQGDSGSVAILGFDQGALTNGLRGNGAVALVRLRDADLAAQTQATVLVVSTADPTGEPISLRRDPLEPGTFYGTFGVEPTVVAGNGQVAVVPGARLTARYTDASPSVLVQSGDVTWNPTSTATITFPETTVTGLKSLKVVVVDPDRDTSVHQQAVSVHLASSSLPTGLDVTLLEAGTPGDYDSGMFEGTIPLKAAPDSTAGALPVRPGDELKATYIDIDSKGHTVEAAAAATWVPAHDGRLDFTDSTFRFPRTAFRGTAPDMVFLRHEDPDLVNRQSVNATVTSGQDAIGIRVELGRTGPGSGEFVGSFGLVTGSSSSATRLRVDPDGDTLTAKVGDAAGANGGPRQATATATWTQAHTGHLQFTNSGFDGPAAATTAAGRLYLQLDDADDPSPALVQVTSLGRDPLGLTVQLASVGNGRFRGCFDLQTQAGGDGTLPAAGTACGPAAGGAVSAGRLLVRGSDVVRATYVDSFDAIGRVGNPIVAQGPPIEGAPVAPPGHGASISFKTCASSCGAPSPTLAAVNTLYGDGAADSVTLEVSDASRNVVSTGAEAAESFTVAVGSGRAPNAWGTGANPDVVAGQGILVTVTETGPDTGLFRGSFGFTRAATSTAQLLSVGSSIDAGSDVVWARYSYSNHPENQPGQAPGEPATCGAAPLPACAPANDRVGRGLVQASAAWRASSAASLHAIGPEGEPLEQLRGPGKVTLLLAGTDSAEDATPGLDEVGLLVRSDSDPAGFLLTLRERYSHARDAQRPPTVGHLTSLDGFVGTLGFSEESSDPKAAILKVKPGDLVSLRYSDPRGPSGEPGVAERTLGWKPATTASWAPGPTEHRGTTASAALTVLDADQNRNPAAIDTVNVLARSPDATDPSQRRGFMITLEETAKDSGVFTANLEFSDAAVSGKASPGDGGRVALSYADKDEHGNRRLLQREFLWFADNHGGHLHFGEAAYSTKEATATLTLVDADADVSGFVDVVEVRVVGPHDGVGEVVTLRETGGNTDRFTGTIGFELVRNAGNGKVKVENGDRITAYYFDRCAATSGSCETASSAPRTASTRWTLATASPPTATIDVTPSSGPAPLRVAFSITASDPDGPLASYSLDYGDGSGPKTGLSGPPASAEYTYNIPGTYTIVLQVTDTTGQKAVRTATVQATGGSAPPASTDTPQSSSSSTSPTTSTSPTSTAPPDLDLSDIDPLALTAQQITALNGRIKVNVERAGTANVISWEIPDTIPEGIQGVQVWRSNSPYTLFATLVPGTIEYSASQIVDDSRHAKPTTKYLVTVFYGMTAPQGFFTEEPPSTSVYPGSRATTPAAPSDWPVWVLAAIAAGGVALLAVGILLARRRRTPASTEPATPPDRWLQTLGDSSHALRCPLCQARFTAMGTKPFSATCPSCGRSGTAR